MGRSVIGKSLETIRHFPMARLDFQAVGTTSAIPKRLVGHT
jgi:hypothetical protein